MIEHWNEASFDWLRWRGGSLTRLGVQHNSYHIEAARAKIREKALAYCAGHRIACRPKDDTVAVMFFDDDEWWTHLTTDEFRTCFPNVKVI